MTPPGRRQERNRRRCLQGHRAQDSLRPLHHPSESTGCSSGPGASSPSVRANAENRHTGRLKSSLSHDFENLFFQSDGHPSGPLLFVVGIKTILQPASPPSLVACECCTNEEFARPLLEGACRLAPDQASASGAVAISIPGSGSSSIPFIQTIRPSSSRTGHAARLEPVTFIRSSTSLTLRGLPE